MHSKDPAIVDAIAQLRPDLWQKCYPKIYGTIPGDYVSPKALACTLLNCAVKVEHGFMGDNEKAELVWASKLANLRVPVFWVTRDLAEALKRTTPPQSINLEHVHLPFEAAVFMLPSGILVNEDANEGEAIYISYVRTHAGEEIPSMINAGPRFWRPADRGTVTVFAETQAEHLLHWTIPNVEQINLGHLDDWIQAFSDEQYRHRSQAPQYCDDTLTAEDNRFMARVMHLIFGIIILMTARADLVAPGTLEKRVAKRGEVPREFWSPTIIGKDYKLRRMSMPQGGTHASPRFHWVRGFLRQQPYGEKRSLRKEIWVEPYERGLGPGE